MNRNRYKECEYLDADAILFNRTNPLYLTTYSGTQIPTLRMRVPTEQIKHKSDFIKDQSTTEPTPDPNARTRRGKQTTLF